MIKGGDIISAIANNSDNIFNYFANRERAKTKLPNLQKSNFYNPILLNTNKEEDEADRLRLLTNKNIDYINTDSAVANANKGRLLLSSILGKNDIINKRNNINSNILNDAKLKNIDIQNNNNKIEFDNSMRRIMQKDDVRREDSTNIANLVNKSIRTRDMEDAREDKINQNILDLASKDPKTVEMIFKNNPNLLKLLTTKRNKTLIE